MSEEFGGDFITLTDEEGNEFELEYCTTVEHNGTVYMAFLTVPRGMRTPPRRPPTRTAVWSF